MANGMLPNEYQLRLELNDLNTKCYQLNVKVTELQQQVKSLDDGMEERIRRKMVEMGVIEPSAEDE
jgi:cell division protein FtsL